MNTPPTETTKTLPAGDLAVAIAQEAGLHRCPHAPADGPVVLCGCPAGRCEAAGRRW